MALTWKQYDKYLFDVEMTFTRRVDSGEMSNETYFRLAKKLDEWGEQYRELTGEEVSQQ